MANTHRCNLENEKWMICTQKKVIKNRVKRYKMRSTDYEGCVAFWCDIYVMNFIIKKLREFLYEIQGL